MTVRHTPPHDVVILAAGSSSRLGQPKQLVTKDGETLLARTVRHALQTRPMTVCVVLGAEAATLARHLAGLPVTVLINEAWQTGMASSLQTAAAALAAHARPALITVVDQPALSGAHFVALLQAFDGSADIISAYGEAAGVPVLLRPQTLARARDLAGDEGFRRLWALESPVRLRADGLGADLDTPDDVQRAIRAGLLDP